MEGKVSDRERMGDIVATLAGNAGELERLALQWADRIATLERQLAEMRKENNTLRLAHDACHEALKSIGALSQELGIEAGAEWGESISAGALACIREQRDILKLIEAQRDAALERLTTIGNRIGSAIAQGRFAEAGMGFLIALSNEFGPELTDGLEGDSTPQNPAQSAEARSPDRLGR